jgi:hypothetical protein
MDNEKPLISELEKLQNHYNETIDFSVFNLEDDARLKFSYECYQAPCHYYIEPFEGRAHLLIGEEASLNSTVSWIDDQTFKSSCFKFKAPARIPDWKVHWGKAKMMGRQWYDANLRDFIETYLRKFKITYCVDEDNTDYKNIASLHQKRDRQIIFLFSALMMIFEWVWDLFFSNPEEKKKSKVKSKISSSVKDVKKPESAPSKDAQTKKRDKIE